MGLLSWLRPKKQEPLLVDQIVLTCVPFGVDQFEQFRDDAKYFDYVKLNVYQLISHIGHQSDKIYEEGRHLVYRAVDSDEDLRVCVSPDYVVLSGESNILCPKYTVAWNHSKRSGDIVKGVVRNAFPLSTDTGELLAVGNKGNETVMSGNELFGKLRPGSLEVRCNWLLANSGFKIKIKKG